MQFTISLNGLGFGQYPVPTTRSLGYDWSINYFFKNSTNFIQQISTTNTNPHESKMLREVFDNDT
jgi:hypothetical protein